jgi:hypothetical protein
MIRGADDDLAAKRVQHALAGVILRRTKESELDGRKLIELPPRQEDWVALEFMEDERAMLVLSSLPSSLLTLFSLATLSSKLALRLYSTS